MRTKVICLNMWLGGLLFEQILDFLRKEDPDIVLLQEVYNSKDIGLEKRFRSMEVLREELKFPYEFFAPTCIAVLKEGEVEAGNAILSKLPIEKTETTFFDIPFGKVMNYETKGSDFSQTPRNLQKAVIKAENTILNIFNTQGIWGKDSEDNERRLKMSEIMADKIKSQENVILAGDFNVMPHTQSIQNIEKYLTNIFKGKLQTTFNLKQKSLHILSSIVVDMMFASPDLKIADAYCPDVDVSDHLPLVAVFEI